LPTRSDVVLFVTHPQVVVDPWAFSLGERLPTNGFF
jgi:hypothetical protein